MGTSRGSWRTTPSKRSASDPGVPVSLEDLWPPNLGDAVTDAAVEEAPHGGTWMWMLLDDNRWASQVVSGNKALLRDY